MEQKHTPGPWNVAKTTFGQTIIDAPSIGEIVCRIEEWSEEQDKANARLIAAAPEMLEACERAEWWLSTHPEGESMRDVLRAAIMKATKA